MEHTLPKRAKRHRCMDRFGARKKGTRTPRNESVQSTCNRKTLHVDPRDKSQPMSAPRKKIITVNDTMQQGYRYELTEPMGKNFHPGFTPDLSPKEMLALGVFGGKYMTDCTKEFPKDWFTHAKLSPKKRDASVNFFHVHASQSLEIWRKNGWINHEHDPRGWFQWYCRYYLGRRIQKEDERQIRRWRAIRRHITQIKRNCTAKDLTCRPTQRQAVLHWAYDSRKI